MAKNPSEKDYTEKEANNRFKKLLQGAFSTAPKPLKEIQKKKSKAARQAKAKR